MITAFRALVRKDIRLFLVDRRALMLSFALPMAIGSFFGYVLGGQGNRADASKIPISGGGPGWQRGFARDHQPAQPGEGAYGETVGTR